MLKKKWLAVALAGAMTLTAVSFAACSVSDGKDGTNGTNGTDGKDGISVVSSEIDENGDLIITYSDGTTQNAGSVSANTKNEIAVLYTNDVHCGFANSEESMGIAGLAAYKAVTESNYGTDSFTMVDIGDFVQGEAIGTISKGSYPVDLMNYVGYDIGTVGNHEFDYGMDELIGEGGLVEQSNMNYVCCNFYYTGGEEDELVFDPYTIVEYGGVSIAYIGIATPETFTKSTPTYFQDEDGNWIYSFCEDNDGADLYAAVQSSIDAAKEEGADYVIAVSHLGDDEVSAPFRSVDVIENTTGLDIVLDGHSHSVIENESVKDKDGNGVVLTSTGTKLAYVGKLVIDTKGTTSTADDVITTELVSAEEVNSSTSFLQKMAYEAADSYYQDIVSQYSDMLNEVVAKSEVTLSTYYSNGARAVRNSETSIGDLCADAYREVMGADIAFVNGGGIRADINEGDITYGDIISIHPYGNVACLIEATGQQIIDALELGSRAVQATAYTEANGVYNAVGELGGFLQVSGIKYTIDTSVESTVVTDSNGMFVEVSSARRVTNVQVLDSATGEYVDIDLTKTYKLASHNYMLKSAGDGYSMFQDCNILLDETVIDNQVLIRYIQESLGGTITADYVSTLTGRITITGRE
ncbi:MAG: 5'-nucleotidase C-terminal domain-containing protein [Clostridia bacterium]|nr:5'-nucleotidase C-terminal domain-containing protein [Clostridia bacterium]